MLMKITDKRLLDYSAPKTESEEAAGIDLRAMLPKHVGRTMGLRPNEVYLISTGVSVSLPPGTMGLLELRSSMRARGLSSLGAGFIDQDYLGELRVVVMNLNTGTVLLRHGDRIAQLAIMEVRRPCIEVVDEFPVQTGRGSGGFGSTGVS